MPRPSRARSHSTSYLLKAERSLAHLHQRKKAGEIQPSFFFDSGLSVCQTMGMPCEMLTVSSRAERVATNDYLRLLQARPDRYA
jgi:hypothetical protein